MGYYSVTKMKKILSFAAAWTNLKDPGNISSHLHKEAFLKSQSHKREKNSDYQVQKWWERGKRGRKDG
jgi:hypothetical protein